MARILYGVAGEGMGHAVRARVVLDHLARNHEVQVVASGRAHDYLAAQAPGGPPAPKAWRIWGMSIVYRDNGVRNLRTLAANVRGGVWGGVRQSLGVHRALLREFLPDLVISDFETWSGLFARAHGVPCISVDNNQVLDRCAHDPAVVAGDRLAYLVARALVRAKVPGCYHYLVSTFFHLPVTRPRTTLHPPVLRPRVLAARPEAGEHLLVYQTTTSNPALLAALRESGRECRVYGLRRELGAELREGNLRFRPFDEDAFVEDLRTARAVISGGSFTLMSEAIHLGKPMLSVPVRRQFEQILNARYLDRLGYGVAVGEVTPAALAAFEERLPELSRALALRRQDGNAELLGHLDALVGTALGARAGAEADQGDGREERRA
jgi:uncharacterized protein (TIGR00661 family)